MSYIFWKLWHSAIIWPICIPIYYILRGVRVVLTQDLTPLPKWSVVLLLKSLFWGGFLWAVVVVKFHRVFNNTAWYSDQSYTIITLCKHRLADDDNDNDYIQRWRWRWRRWRGGEEKWVQEQSPEWASKAGLKSHTRNCQRLGISIYFQSMWNGLVNYFTKIQMLPFLEQNKWVNSEKQCTSSLWRGATSISEDIFILSIQWRLTNLSLII